MRRNDRRFKRGWLRGFAALAVPLVLALLLMPVLLLLLQGDRLPCTHDNIFHSYRIVAMREMLRHGWLFSRWVPNLALGYGYPFFTYREPLPYLVGEGLYALGMPLPLVKGGLYAVSLIAGAWGAYVLARDLFGPHAAWVSAVAYGLAPYVLMDVLRRGNMPESVGLALLPWLFVVMRRLILYKGRWRFIVMVLLLAALFLSHNISSLLLAPFLGLYAVLLTIIHYERRGWLYAFSAVAVAVLLTAWFWLPALTEQDVVQLHLSRTTRNNDFRYNFVSWDEMVATPPVPYDPAYVNPPMRVSLGIGRTALAVMGILLGLWRARDRETRGLVALLALAGLGYLWMATPGALGVWEAIPLLSFVQFPWRLVGRALLPASLLAGLAVEVLLASFAAGNLGLGRIGLHDEVDGGGGRLRRRPGGAWLPALTVGVCVGGLALLAWPESYPPKGMCGVARFPDLTDLYARELEGWMGMDPENSYFPIWVESHPEDTALAEAFQRGELPARFDAAALPEGAEILAATYRPLRATVTLDSPVPFEARWLGFYYPGWRVEVDGEAVATVPEDDTGLMRFAVPGGQHTVRIWLGLTPPRAVGAALAVVGVAIASGTLLLSTKNGGSPHRSKAGLGPIKATDAAGDDSGGASSRHQRRLLWSVLGVGVGLLVARYALDGRVQTPWQRSRLAVGDLPEVAIRADQPFSGGLRLIGAEIDAATVVQTATLRGDDELAVSLLWLAEQQPAQTYRTSVLLRGQDGQIWSPAGTLRPRGYEPPLPSPSWEAGSYVYDPHIVTPNPGAPPGHYEVVVALFDAETLAPAAPLDDGGRPLGTDWVVGSVELLPPSAPPSVSALGVSSTAAVDPCGPVALLGFSLDRDTGVPGDLVAVRWVWEAVATPETALTPTLSLVGPEGELFRAWSLPAAANWWPTDRWAVGERWAGQHVVRLPRDLESGDYAMRVDMPGCDMAVGRATFEVAAPARTWSVPDALKAAAVRFGDQVLLAGYGIEPTEPSGGETVVVTLAWQAVAPMDTAYRIFVHLIDGNGTLVAQDDGEPAGWTRPTTGWLEGEVVVEQRRLPLPSTPQNYMVHVGVYAPDGTRLWVADGEDSGCENHSGCKNHSGCQNHSYVLGALNVD
jgi:hypothetical protein